MDGTGYAAFLRERTARVVAANPSQARRILGIRPEYVAPVRAAAPAGKQIVVPNKEAVAKPPTTRTMANRIVVAVAEAWNTIPYVILSANRGVRATRPRFACCRLLSTRLNLSTPKIGYVLGRDHTTVMHGLSRAKDLYDHDPDWRARYDAVVAELEMGGRT
jgi:chromosomal replication initiation ATPase DnaA